MSRDKLQDQLAAARAALRDRPLSGRDQEALGQTLDDLERMAETADPASFIELLRAWEAKLEVDHPVLAGVLGDVVRKLGSMGI